MVIKNTEKYLCFLLVFLSSISSSIASSSAVAVSTNEEAICTGGFGGGFGDDDVSIGVSFVVCFGGRRSALWMDSSAAQIRTTIQTTTQTKRGPRKKTRTKRALVGHAPPRRRQNIRNSEALSLALGLLVRQVRDLKLWRNLDFLPKRKLNMQRAARALFSSSATSTTRLSESSTRRRLKRHTNNGSTKVGVLATTASIAFGCCYRSFPWRVLRHRNRLPNTTPTSVRGGNNTRKLR